MGPFANGRDEVEGSGTERGVIRIGSVRAPKATGNDTQVVLKMSQGKKQLLLLSENQKIPGKSIFFNCIPII